MTIALFANSKLLLSSRPFLKWLSLGRLRSTHKQRKAPEATKMIAECTHSARANSTYVTSTKPLRVIRVIETGQSRSTVGRMVISGRMADVCAELDRLVAREAALS